MSITTIEWCARPGTIPETWNPTTGCNKLSRGCKHCYAEIMHRRLKGMGQVKYQRPFLEGAVEHHNYDLLTMPLGWKKPRTVFVDSMSDLFHKDISDPFIDQVFAVMALATDHTFIICTKRADIMHSYFKAGKNALIERWVQATYEIGDNEQKGLYYDEDESYAACWINNVIPQRWPLPNVWLLISTEDQPAFDKRYKYLLDTPAAVRGLSCEPLVGLLNIMPFLDGLKGESGWVIAGGESGSKADPMHPDWPRSLRDQCQATKTPFFFKQWGEWIEIEEARKLEYLEFEVIEKSKIKYEHAVDANKVYCFYKLGKHATGRMLDGEMHNEFPEVKPISYAE